MPAVGHHSRPVVRPRPNTAQRIGSNWSHRNWNTSPVRRLAPPAAMGGLISRREANEGDPCPPCFFLGNGIGPSKRASDPIGTPLPETPVHQRRKRQHVQDALRSETENYKGLEKEVPEVEETNGQNGSSPPTVIHDGPASEQELHAKYQLLEVLGVGSTSTVHRCRDKKTDTEFACKIIDVRMIEDRFAGMMEQFQTEITALKSLRHPSIIRLYDVYLTDEKIYIIMELMQGGELFDYVVQKGTLTEEEAAKIVRKVTSAIAYMHSQNFIHRDLKPENLLLKQAPKTPYDDIDVKLIDFGLSKAMEENEPMARTFLGTRGYLSPEQLSRRDYTKAVDSWALGVIVFVLLCGCLPFDDDSSQIPSDELVKIKFKLRYPRWAKNLSPSAKDLLSHLLDVNPATRYTAEDALSHPWVRGVTAPRDNLLASPGRMKKSPVVMQSAARYSGSRRQHPAIQGQRSPPTPDGTMVRKSSI